jgi:FkbM family methyltransferase
VTWYSQAGQDRWVVDMLGDRPGYFVDVGAYDGIQTSNTYALELAGWHGVCIEASPAVAAACASNRRCHTVAKAATATEGYVRLRGDRIVPHGGIQVPSGTLTEILRSVDAPAAIDYLSLDIEGGELLALQGLDFERYTVTLITVEHNLYAAGPAHKDAIYDFLTGRGFVLAVDNAPCLDPDPRYYMRPYEDWYMNSAFRASYTSRLPDISAPVP